MGEMGKTQLGIHMTRHSGSRYSLAYWLSANEGCEHAEGRAPGTVDGGDRERLRPFPTLTEAHWEEGLV